MGRRRLGSALPLLWLAAWLVLALGSSQLDRSFRLERALASPTLAHPFGFDVFGRDVLTVVLQASITSAGFAAAATAVAGGLALAVGTLLAFAPPGLQFVALRLLDTFMAFPSLLFALGWAATQGPGWSTLFIALLLGTAPGLIRLVHVRAREELAEPYILASRSLGAGTPTLLGNHIIPTAARLCSVKLPNLFAHAILAEATLSFLGIGAPLGHDTWGSLLLQAKEYLIEAPHLALGAGIPLVLTVLSLLTASESLSGSSAQV